MQALEILEVKHNLKNLFTIQLYLSYDTVRIYDTSTQELALRVSNFITIISKCSGFLYYQVHTLTSCSGINTVYTDLRKNGLCFLRDVLCSNLLEYQNKHLLFILLLLHLKM